MKPKAEVSVTEAIAAISDPTPAETLTTENILDELWKADVNRLTVSDRDEKGEWRDPKADILLDKQNRAKGAADSLEDSAPRPLFHTVSAEALSRPTYRTFIELLDNYDAVVNNVEYLNDGELDEIFAFLDAILETECMKMCFKYVTEVLGFSYTMETFRRQLFSMWFELHTLRVDEVLAPSEVEAEREAIRSEHKERPETASATEPVFGREQVIVRYCSGFEHVFLGEVTVSNGGATQGEGSPVVGNVLGMHSWLTFYIDEYANQTVDFLGTKYTKPSLSKIGAPFVCVKFRWDHEGHTYIKERGSFFVGCSPEFSIAMATVCFFETWTVEMAHKCGWENKIPTKFKSRRDIGGYKYEYYICRQSKYLVSCFQELIGMSEETEAKLKELQRLRDDAVFAAKMAAKQQQVKAQIEDIGITLPDGTSLSRKAYNRLKRRLQAQADEEGITVEDLIASGRVQLPTAEESAEMEKSKDNAKDTNKEAHKEHHKGEKQHHKKDKPMKAAQDKPQHAQDGKEEKTENVSVVVSSAPGSPSPSKATATAGDATATPAFSIVLSPAKPSPEASVSACECSVTLDGVSVGDSTDALSFDVDGSTGTYNSTDVEGSEMSLDGFDIVPLPNFQQALSLPEGQTLTISPCTKPIKAPICRFENPRPQNIKPKISENKDRDFQAFAKEFIADLKKCDCGIADKDAFKRAQEAWAAQGKEVKKGMGMPIVKKRNQAPAPAAEQ